MINQNFDFAINIHKRKLVSKVFSGDVFRFLILLGITIVLRKVLPNILFTVFLFFTLILFYRGKRDIIYLIYAFVLTYDVGGIIGFKGYTIINLEPLVLMYFDLFSVVAFIKTFNYKNNNKFINNNVVRAWFIYGLFLLVYGIVAFGYKDFGGNTGLRYFFYLFRLLLSILFFVSLPKLIRSKEDIIKIAQILFVLVFINFAGQLFYITGGKPIFSYITGVTTGEAGFKYMLGKNVLSAPGTLRPEYGSNIRFIALFLAVYFYYKKENIFKRKYLLIIIITILISTFITATRGWVLSFSFFLLLTSFLTKKGIKIIKVLGTGLLLFSIVFSFSVIFRAQVIKSYERLTTLELLAEGDVTAGGTNKRLTDRLKPVMDVFYDYPLFGVGISGLGMKTSDHHVGNPTILMGEGIVGMLLFLVFIYTFIINTFKLNNRLWRFKSGYSGELMLIIFSFLSLLIIHSSSQGLLGWLIYAVHPEKILFIVLLFVIYNQIIIENINKYAIKRLE